MSRSKILSKSFLAKDREIFGNPYGVFRNLEETLGFRSTRPAPLDAIFMSLTIREDAKSDHKGFRNPTVLDIGIATLDTRSFFDFKPLNNQNSELHRAPAIKTRNYKPIPRHMLSHRHVGTESIDPDDIHSTIFNSFFIPEDNPEHPTAMTLRTRDEHSSPPKTQYRNIILVGHKDEMRKTIGVIRRLGIAKKLPIVGVFDTVRLAETVLRMNTGREVPKTIKEPYNKRYGKNSKPSFSYDIMSNHARLPAMLEELGVEIPEEKFRFTKNTGPFTILLMLMLMLKKAESTNPTKKTPPKVPQFREKTDHLRAFIRAECDHLSVPHYTGRRSEESKRKGIEHRRKSREERSQWGKVEYILRQYLNFIRPNNKLTEEGLLPPPLANKILPEEEEEEMEQWRSRIENASEALDPRSTGPLRELLMRRRELQTSPFPEEEEKAFDGEKKKKMSPEAVEAFLEYIRNFKPGGGGREMTSQVEEEGDSSSYSSDGRNIDNNDNKKSHVDNDFHLNNPKYQRVNNKKVNRKGGGGGGGFFSRSDARFKRRSPLRQK